MEQLQRRSVITQQGLIRIRPEQSKLFHREREKKKLNKMRERREKRGRKKRRGEKREHRCLEARASKSRITRFKIASDSNRAS